MTLSLNDLAELMREIDTCMVVSVSGDLLEARPMSNNNDVAWDGTSWFFASAGTGLITQAGSDARLVVVYSGKGVWIAVSGSAVVHEDRDLMRKHWNPDIDRWFADGVDTPELRLLQVSSEKVRYWTYEHGDGEIDV